MTRPWCGTGSRSSLNLEEDIDVVAVAGDGRQCLREVARTRPDVVLMDIRMPVLDGIAATEEIMRSGASARVLILTTFDLDVYVYRALRAGASGFLLKDVPRQQLAAAVRIVADGGSVVGPAITQRLIEHFVGRPPVGNPLPPTQEATDRPRERDPASARAGPGQPGTRASARPIRRHGQDPRRDDPRQTRSAGPAPGGGPRLRVGFRPAGTGGRRQQPGWSRRAMSHDAATSPHLDS